ncbi:hypothetical protein LOC68_09045 [Blastopirellula sp. JC732]|uniref:Uncharacterized protein n=1 Tax=Blastopirellula sediminis TaxID=2894196 RepID=A0A9X1SGC6_9BACT|nr:hypothetical protein [Blastopirellula sediminis]MCC9608682.1 hypothetical protein [Blastopirellula sediminis]MCC9628541.1 hypothetical protein [Blastopirellula sediminis]
MRTYVAIATTLALLISFSDRCSYAEEASGQHSHHSEPRLIGRIFWQNEADATLAYGDLTRGEKWALEPKAIPGFPQLDRDSQTLVQMQAIGNVLVAGVRDMEEGELESGWIAIDGGGHEEEHGDHTHWRFTQAPQVLATQLDDQQGNPAHLYQYDGAFYLANDQKNGFTRLRPEMLAKGDTAAAAKFFAGGGQHITLAAVNDQVAYSTWIDGKEENSGRIDVVNLRESENGKGNYKIHTPTGGLHGATANSGRVFFAPADGICWVDADRELIQTEKSTQVHHVSLGKDPETEKPLRTGAFANAGHWVLFTSQSSEESFLGLIDATASEPKVQKLPIEAAEGLRLTTPQILETPSGLKMAFLFQDRHDGDATEQLTAINLDPDRNGDFSDAKIVKHIPIGKSKIVGHSGHHDICIMPGGRYACISNPGDGTIWVMSLTRLEVLEKIKVDGVPNRIVTIGN